MTHLSVLWVYPFQKYQIFSSWHFLSWIFFWEIRHALGRLAKLTVQTFAISDNSWLCEFKSSAEKITKVFIRSTPHLVDRRASEIFLRTTQWAEIHSYFMHMLYNIIINSITLKSYVNKLVHQSMNDASGLFVCFPQSSPAFQVCTGSCHINVPALRLYHHNMLQEPSHPIASSSGSIRQLYKCSE